MRYNTLFKKYVVALCLTALLPVLAHADQPIGFGHSSFLLRNRPGGYITYATATVDEFANQTAYETNPLRMELWYGPRCFTPTDKKLRVFVLASKNLGYDLQSSQLAYDETITSNKQLRVGTGKGKVTLAFLDQARTGVYGYICFPKAISIK